LNSRLRDIDPPPVSNPVLAALRRWLVDRALHAAPVPEVAGGFADGLLRAGLPLWRAHVAVSALDPEVESIGLTWTRTGDRAREEFGHGSFDRISLNSPIYDAVVAARAKAAESAAESAGPKDPQDSKDPEELIPMTRYRLERGEGLERYAVMREFRAEGATDYLVFVVPFYVDGVPALLRRGAVVTLATDRAGGFAEAEVEAIVELMPTFGAAMRVGADLVSIRTVLDTYLGRDVGRRVLQGEIRRGSVETIAAAVLLGDLRGFTALADELPRDVIVGMLDEYLECLVGPVEVHGGQVLKFLGDGLLATFAFGAAEPRHLCADALAAATAALDRIEAVNLARKAAGLPVTTLDLALHLGDVAYGNVGSDRRLDFTVIGPAVNETSRLEGLCGTFDVPLVASGRFVEALGEPARFRSLGHRQLRGVRSAVEVFALG
jgi:adenylate cyclase